MTIKNEIKKGTVLKIEENEGVFYLLSNSGARLNITDKLSSVERTNIKHLGKALALVKDNENIDVVTCVQFHTHSEYSVLDGLSKLKELAKASSGITAITDHGNMHGMLKWQKCMKAEGKKALFGCEVYIETVGGEKEGNHLILIAKDEIGKKNLFTLTSNAYHNFYRKPHVKFEEIKVFSEGLICTSACIGGEISKAILEKGYDEAKKVAIIYKEIFGDDFYIEIQRHNISEELIVNPQLIQLSKELDIKLVAGNDSHYLNTDDDKYHELLLCINQKKTLAEEHWSFEGEGYHFMSDNEMINLFWDIPEAISNTFEIALKCNLEIETGVYHLPKFDIPKEFANEEEYLSFLIAKGFKERFEGTPHYTDEVYLQRIEFEKSVIMSMGFSAYFLIVADYVNWAKDNGILVGAGRGSGAGSLVCYCLKITDLNPIPYDLLFERFLNPDRISMPDIDMDFEDSRRGEVIDYIKSKYGEDNVCNIITFNTLKAKSSIRDVARTIGNRTLGDNVAKLITEDISLKETIEENPEFAKAYNTDANVKKLVDMAMKVEGTTRTTGVHACGMLVADKPIRNYMPTALVKGKTKDEKILATQVTEVEDLGLLKMDILGLKTMSVIGGALEYVNPDRVAKGLKPFGYYREITLTDPYVYAEISEGTSFAVFQIESAGMRKFMVDLFSDVKRRIRAIENKYQLKGYGDNIEGEGLDKDDYLAGMTTLGEELFERIIAGISLYRPGPMDYIPDYIKGMNKPSEIKYDLPALKPILENTYGVITYQEQVMLVVRELAGFSKGDADGVRKGMGKKIQAVIDEYKEYFINGSDKKNIKGCVANGISKELAESIWEKMADFGKYAFNKSHAGVYAVLTVTCAWLKHYYPNYYMCAMMNTYIDTDKLSGYIDVAKKLGIKILPPSVNHSVENFSIENGNIRFGLKGLKNLSKTVKDIVEERCENGEHKSLQEFVYRNINNLNKRSLMSLIYSGALDSFGYNRNSMLNAIENILKQARKDAKKSGQLSLFEESGYVEIEIPTLDELNELDLLKYEKEYAGLYISKHPLDLYEKELSALNSTNICFFTDDEGEVIESSNSILECVVTVGIVKNFVIRYTKRDNKPMATFTLEDATGDVNCVVFANDYESLSHHIKNNAILVVRGDVSQNDFGLQLIVKSLSPIEEYIVNTNISKVFVKLESIDDIPYLQSYLTMFQGDTPVFVQVGDKLYDTYSTVSATSNLFMHLQDRYGRECVIYR